MTFKKYISILFLLLLCFFSVNAVDTWTTLNNAPYSSQYSGSQNINGDIFLFGGETATSTYTGATYKYNVLTDSWTIKTTMPNPRRASTNAQINDAIYVISGYNGAGTNYVSKYNITSNLWSSLANYPISSYATRCAGDTDNKDYIYCFGGFTSAFVNNAYKYNIATNTWSAITSFPETAGYMGANYYNGKIYLSAGYLSGSASNKLYIYDIGTNSYSSGSTAPTSFYSHGSIIGQDNILYTFGGYLTGNAKNHVYAYNISSNTWSTKTPMLNTLYGVGVFDNNGNISVINGYSGSAYTNKHYQYYAYDIILTSNPSIEINNITFNNISNFNNSFYNSNINISLELINTSTNGNINSTYYITNFEENATYNGNYLNGALAVRENTATQYCLDTFGSLSSLINYTISSTTLQSYATYNVMWFNQMSSTRIDTITCLVGKQFGTNNLTPSGSINISELATGEHDIYFYVYNNETNATSSTYTITLDTQPATVFVNEFTEWNAGYTVTSLNTTLNLTCEDPNIFECEIHFDDNTTINLFTTQSKTFSTNGNHTFYLHAHDLAGNIAETNGTIFINPNQTFYFNDVNGSQITNFTFGGIDYETKAEFPLYDLGLGNHTLLFEKLGYDLINITFEFTLTSGYNSTFNISFAEIIINVFDGETNNLITNTVTTTLVGMGGSTKTTTSGIVSYIGANLGGSYSLTTSTNGYDNENYYFTFNNQEVKNISIYMLNVNISEQFTFQCKGPFSDNLVGATLKSTRWDSSTSQYLIYSMDETDGNGQGTLNLEKGVYYVVLCEYEDRLGTLPSAVYTSLDAQNIIPITVPLSTVGTTFNQVVLPNVNSNITADYSSTSPNTTAYFELIYNDPSEEATKHCLKLYTYNGAYSTQINYNEITDCSSNPTGVIVKTFNYTNGTNYIAKYYITVNGKEYLQDFETFDTKLGLSSNSWLYFIIMGLVLMGVWLGYTQNFMELGITGVLVLLWILHIADWFLTASGGRELLYGLTFMGLLAIWGVNKLK